MIPKEYGKFLEFMQGNKRHRGLETGDFVWWHKNPNNTAEGILYGEIARKMGSDFVVRTSRGLELTLPYERIYLFLRGEHDFCNVRAA